MIYVLSDLHLSKFEKIPSWIIEKLKESDLILVNGDITSKEILNEICSYSKCYAVRGNCDSLNLPLYNLFEISGIKCGQIHGDSIFPRGDKEELYNLAQEMNVNILFTGHTHKYSIYEYKNKLFINPGSVTLPKNSSKGTIAEISLEKELINIKILSENSILLNLTFKEDSFK